MYTTCWTFVFKIMYISQVQSQDIVQITDELINQMQIRKIFSFLFHSKNIHITSPEQYNCYNFGNDIFT